MPLKYDTEIDESTEKTAKTLSSYVGGIKKALVTSVTISEAMSLIGYLEWPTESIAAELGSLMLGAFLLGGLGLKQKREQRIKIDDLKEILTKTDNIDEIIDKIKKKSTSISLKSHKVVSGKVYKILISSYIKYRGEQRSALLNASKELIKTGILKTRPHYLKTVMDTAAANSYQLGRYRGAINTEEKYWTYRTQGDSRVRPSHRELEGRTYHVADPFWSTYYPPNGYNCRCYVQSSTKGTSDRDYPDVEPDPGFSGTPEDFFKDV